MKKIGLSSEGVVVIPEDVEIIPPKEFLDCEAVFRVVVPSNVRVVEHNAFSGCVNLGSVEFPDGIEILTGSFKGCIGLTRIHFKGSMSTNFGSFFECTGLKSIKIPDNSKIGMGASANCTQLESVQFLGDECEIVGGAFKGCQAISDMNIPDKGVLRDGALTEMGGLRSVCASILHDLRGLGLQNGSVTIVRKPYRFVPMMIRRMVDREYNTFTIGKKLSAFVLLCFYRGWSQSTPSEGGERIFGKILGLPPELGLLVLSFVDICVSERFERVIPEDEALASECLRSNIAAIEEFQMQKWFSDFVSMPKESVFYLEGKK